MRLKKLLVLLKMSWGCDLVIDWFYSLGSLFNLSSLVQWWYVLFICFGVWYGVDMVRRYGGFLFRSRSSK